MVVDATEYTNYYNSEEYDTPNVSWVPGNNVIHYDGSICFLKILPFTNNTPRRILKKGGNTLTLADVSSLTHTNNDDVIIGEGITHIAQDAFKGYSGLKSITIPKTLVHIAQGVFENCTNLNRVNITDLESWCNITFVQTSNSNPLSRGHRLFLNGKEVNHLIIPDSVTVINRMAFSGCHSIEKLTIPNSVTEIGMDAFRYAENLTNFVLPESINIISGGAFGDCTSLTNIFIPKSVTQIDNSAFMGCSNSTLNVAVDAENPNYDSRDNCNGIIETATDTMFFGCRNSIIPNTVKSLVYTFQGCSNLTEITIPEGVTYIGWTAFTGCSGLTGNLTIPSTVTSLNFACFSGCTGLDSFTFLSTTPPSLSWAKNEFDGTTCPIYVPATSVDAYKASWTTYASRIQAIPS